MSISKDQEFEKETQFIDELIQKMTLDEKIGQMNQIHVVNDLKDEICDDIRAGRIGSMINVGDLEMVNEFQRVAREQSRLGIPLLVGRDVIHGYKTIMPIPLGQAATWNPELVYEGARIAATEAAADGINWTFAPMIDISRDARWGRIAESLGEDPYLTAKLGAAMVEGFQGEDPSDADSIAACAKHFAGYGTSEAGRDYSTTNVPENELRNIYLPPFKAAVDSGVMSIMTSFSDLDGIPGTANEFLLRGILRGEWNSDAITLSDFNAIQELQIHGLTANEKDSAREAINAGIDMEMASGTYLNNMVALVKQGQVSEAYVDAAVTNILRVKFRLGLFDGAQTDTKGPLVFGSEPALKVAKDAAVQSVVLLKNHDGLLPLSPKKLDSLAVIGPLADDPYEQLGTWVFDGDSDLSVTPLNAVQKMCGDEVEVTFVKTLETSRAHDTSEFDAALSAANGSDAVLLFLGEEAILSGEAHCRADIRLPGAQEELIRCIRQAGKPVIATIMAGRPLVLTDVLDQVDAILYAWHPGTMAGPALADLIFGVQSPSGKLPVTFPSAVGQIPIYYNHKHSGRPPTPDTVVHIDDIGVRVPQTSLGMTVFHLDAGYKPLFPFGYGLSYTKFEYSNLQLSSAEIAKGESVIISVDLANIGNYQAEEVVQVYVRDLVGSVTRPVRELKKFQRVRLEPGDKTRVQFELHAEDLAFYGRANRAVVEAGDFHVWIGGSSECELQVSFCLV